MPIVIRSLHQDDRDALLALWSAAAQPGQPVPSAEELARAIQTQAAVSLAVLEDRTLIGATTCVQTGRGSLTHHLILAAEHRSPALLSLLMDKTVFKMRTLGWRKMAVRCVGAQNNQPMWGSLSWTNMPELRAPAAVTDRNRAAAEAAA
jgi:hypothetical protein